MSSYQFEQSDNPGAATAEQRSAVLADPKFGTVFSDHMATVSWSESLGWHDAKVGPLTPFPLHPASAVLHYAQEIFEGLKAYRSPNGNALLFRPQENARRFRESALRLAMPPVPEDLFVGAIEHLVRKDQRWIPTGEGTLYLRPFMFADDVFLGVRPSSHYRFCVIASPVGAYFRGGMNPITVWISEDYSRAVRGGTGAAKCGGNYAASLLAQAEATAYCCDQVVFLDANERRWIEELGGMNIFFVMREGTIVTPPLGTILPGITRDSVIQLARDAGYRVEERSYSIENWRSDAISGQLVETFVCGTAATIVPVGRARSKESEFSWGDGQAGPVTEALRDALIALQRGVAADPRGWRHEIALGAAA